MRNLKNCFIFFKKKASLVLLMIGYFLLLPAAAWAIDYQIEVPLPGAPETFSNPAQYFQYFFIFSLALIGFLAVGALIAGGVMWMLGDSISSVEKAKNIIVGGLSGLILLLASYLLLYTIDPKLTDLTLQALEKIDIQALVEELDIPASELSKMSPEQIQELIKQGRIAGNGTIACSITACGAQTIGNYSLSTGGAADYIATQQAIQQSCQSQGLNCTTALTATIDDGGKHDSSCHKSGNGKSGTCGDFVIVANDPPNCQGNIKNCSSQYQQTYIQLASQALNGSQYTTSCLNEYQVKTKYGTGGHFHCNF